MTVPRAKQLKSAFYPMPKSSAKKQSAPGFKSNFGIPDEVPQKETVEFIPPPDLHLLSSIIELRISSSANDASMLIADGAVLLGVARVLKDERPFRFALGWPKSAGKPSEMWESYRGK